MRRHKDSDPLTTSMSVSAFAMDAIIKVEADRLYNTQANVLSSQVKVLHKGSEMSMNELFHTYMNHSERKRQVTSDITINFIDSIQTSLTTENSTF